jgi:hypothetical protein
MFRLPAFLRVKLQPVHVAIVAGVVVAGLDLLVEFWRWLGQVP